jgi:transposase
MSTITLLAIDLAKSSFQLHGVDARGKAVHRSKVSRGKLFEAVVLAKPARIAMEACGSAHYWAKRFQAAGIEVVLIAAQFVKPFVKSNKNDASDAEAIAEAAMRPSMRFVTVKQDWQLEVQALHRVRSRLVANRTALVNQIRGELAEFGIVWSQGVEHVRRLLPALLHGAEGAAMSSCLRSMLADLHAELVELDDKVEVATHRIKTFAAADGRCRRLMTIPGIGPIIATALSATCGDAADFRNGRCFAAYLGLVPRHSGTGGKNRLGGISKRGDIYLRSLLIQGAQSVVLHAAKKKDSTSSWIKALKERRGTNRTAVAVANKTARIAWAVLKKEEVYRAAA